MPFAVSTFGAVAWMRYNFKQLIQGCFCSEFDGKYLIGGEIDDGLLSTGSGQFFVLVFFNPAMLQKFGGICSKRAFLFKAALQKVNDLFIYFPFALLIEDILLDHRISQLRIFSITSSFLSLSN